MTVSDAPDSTRPGVPPRRFRPSLFSVLLTAIGIAAFVWLGTWQLDRAQEKQELVAQYTAGQQTEVAITPQNAHSLSRYQRVRVSGRYDPAHQILLDNMPSHQGRPGYRVLTPMATASGWLLIDRGWLPLGATRQQLPEIAVGADERTITGTFDALPRPGIQLQAPVTPADAPWPRVLSFPQQSDLEHQLGHQLIAGLVLLDAAQPDGYERQWDAHLGFSPERHIGYAVQWFAFACVALVLFVIFGFRTKKGTDEHAR